MKHILFYTDTPNVGGAEKHMFLLAKYLKLNGIKVSLAYGKYSLLESMRQDFESVCEQVFVLNTFHKHDPRHFSELKKILAQEKFDLAHLHLWNPGSCRYAFFALSSSHVPIVTTEHDPFELSGLKKFIKKMCLQNTSRTITVSSENLRLLNEYYQYAKKKLELVPNGIELDRFLNNVKKADLPIKKGAQVITCIAELHHRKGHRYLIEAFRKLQIHMPYMELILIGRGPAEEEIKDQIASIPNIHLLGWRQDIPQILKASDILVLPSLKEAFGQVILEAMASGVIVVATNNGGPVDIIQNGVTGYLVSPANSDAIAEKISIILKNTAHKKDIEKAALDRVRQSFSAEKMGKSTLEVYEKIW